MELILVILAVLAAILLAAALFVGWLVVRISRAFGRLVIPARRPAHQRAAADALAELREIDAHGLRSARPRLETRLWAWWCNHATGPE